MRIFVLGNFNFHIPINVIIAFSFVAIQAVVIARTFGFLGIWDDRPFPFPSYFDDCIKQILLDFLNIFRSLHIIFLQELTNNVLSFFFYLYPMCGLLLPWHKVVLLWIIVIIMEEYKCCNINKKASYL